MIEDILSKKDFPIREFLNELDKKELLFLTFLNVSEPMEIELLYRNPSTMEFFFRELRKVVSPRLRKLTKEELIHSLAPGYEDAHITSIIYEKIYHSAADASPLAFSPKLLAIQRFVTMLFSKKTEKLREDNLFGEQPATKRAVLEAFHKRMLYPQRPVLNSLGISLLIGKRDADIEDLLDSPTVMLFREALICLLFDQFGEIEKNQQETLRRELNKKKVALARSEESLKKKEETLAKVKEKNRELSSDLKKLQNECKEIYKQKKHAQPELLEELYENIQKKDKQIEQYAKDLKKLKEKPSDMYENRIKNLQDQLVNMKDQHKEKTDLLKTYKKKVECLESKTIETHIQEFIDREGFTAELYGCIEPLVEEHKRKIQIEEERKAAEAEKAYEEERQEQKIGYCVIEEGKYYAVFSDGEHVEIKDIPLSTYIGNRQFVKVELNGTFKWAYSYKYEESERDYLIHDFGSVIYQNNEPYLMKAVWDKRKIENLSPRVNLRENQIISVNGKGELVRFYRLFRPNADLYLDSIRAKGQKAYYVLKILPNGMLLRDIETEEEVFKPIETGEKEVQEQQVIYLQDDEIVFVYRSPKFYTFSSLYKKAEHGVAEIEDDTVFIKKMSGEVAIVHDIPEKFDIESGDIITVDEFNNFMTVKKDKAFVSETEERKRLSSSFNKIAPAKKGESKLIEIDKDVLIVGKITYENSYKMSLYKKGYRAEVIDGYESWAKIRSSIREKDMVVIVTEFISHENMWRIKDEQLDVPVIYSEYDGANRIVEQVEEKFKRQEVI